MGAEVIVPFSTPPDRVGAVTHVRGTLINTSLQTLREMNLYDTYIARLSPKNMEQIVSIVAGTWVPMELALLHYQTCESLDVGPSTLAEIGNAVSKRFQGTFLSTVLRVAAGSGTVSPWTPLTQVQRLYDRVFQGGAVSITKLGPKEARLDFVANPLCVIGYYRGGLKAIITATGELFSRKCVVREVQCGETSVAYRMSWA